MAWTLYDLIIVPNLYDLVKNIGKQTVLVTIENILLCVPQNKKSYRFGMIWVSKLWQILFFFNQFSFH